MATKTKSSTAESPVTEPVAPTKSARPKSCGALWAIAPAVAAEGCRRLPRHHGDHVVGAKPRGLMSPKERAAATLAAKASKKPVTRKPKASVKGSKVVTSPDGTKFRVTFGPDGSAVLTPVRHVVVVAEAPSERKVAAPVRRTKSVRRVNKPTESAAMRRAGHVTKTAATA